MSEGEQVPIPPLGRVARIMIGERVRVTEIASAEVISDVVVEAKAKSAKVDLGENVEPIEGMEGGKVAYGGQDAVGAAVFEGGRIQALLVAADGCSFGDRTESAQAARITVDTVLKEGLVIARQGSIDRADVVDRLVRSLRVSHARIKNKAPSGATTAALAAISRERIDGRNQVYLLVASSGDSQVMIVSKDRNGKTQVRRIVEPADAADKALRGRMGDVEDMPVNLAQLERTELIRKFANAAGLTEEEAANQLTQSGIYAFLGGKVDLGIRSFRVNLTADRFEKGHTGIKVMVCSDNAGEKVPEQEIAGIYERAGGDNKKMAAELNSLMGEEDKDDGCLAILSVHSGG